MRDYVYAPANPKDLQSSLALKCLEYIGSTQAGNGSDMAKGKRYLKNVLHCSGRAIKRAVNVYQKVINNDFQEYGLDTYYYHIDNYIRIIEEIINFLKTYSNDEKKIELFGFVPSEDEYIELLCGHRLSQLEWVNRYDYYGQAEKAMTILKEFHNKQPNK